MKRWQFDLSWQLIERGCHVDEARWIVQSLDEWRGVCEDIIDDRLNLHLSDLYPYLPIVGLASNMWLYRHYDEEDRLLYVGIAVNLRKRTGDHRRSSSWWTFRDHSSGSVYRTSDEARQAERQAIKNESPLFNLQGQTSSATRDCVEYLIRRGRLDLLGYIGKS
jgi:hypothetical protein